MADEKISQELRLKSIEKTRNYFIEKIEQNELMSKKHKRFVWPYIILSTFSF